MFAYEDGRRHRPDIMFHTAPYVVVTDLSMIADEYNLEQQELKKDKSHLEACAKQQAIFIPLVMHTKGTIGQKGEKLINSITKAVIPAQAMAFKKEMHHTIAVAAAKGRSQAILAAVNRWEW